MYDSNFEKMLKFVIQREGGYVNDPNDLGGETNKGITHTTYNSYRRSKGLPIQSVKYITNSEVRDIYYNNYYKASGADKISNPTLAAYVFDTAVNMGVSRAKTFLSQCDGNPDKFEKLRRAKYDEFVKAKPSQKKYLQGWNNRVTQLKSFANANFPTSNSESESKTPVLKAGIEKNVYIGDTYSGTSNMSDAIRRQYWTQQRENNEKLNRIFKLNTKTNNSENGHWVTMNGAHVFIEDK